MSRPQAYEPVAITTRSGQPESVHFGALVALNRDGSVAFSVGDPSVMIFPRSSNKPMQAAAMVRNGLALPPRLLALVCASHDGAAMHLAGAQEILATVGLTAAALQTTADLPLDVAEAEAVLRGGGGRTPLQMNCSGKHAGMLAACVTNGWPVGSYLDADHPLQQTINDEFPSFTGEALGPVGVDGCGAPTHVMSLVGLARSFRTLANGDAGVAGNQVFAAMTGHPDMVGGERRDVTRLMRNVPGLMAKDGADGVFAAALADGRVVALKVADGGNRARPPLMIAALEALGIDVSAAAPLVRERIWGHGREVGEVTSIASFVHD